MHFELIEDFLMEKFVIEEEVEYKFVKYNKKGSDRLNISKISKIKIPKEKNTESPKKKEGEKYFILFFCNKNRSKF